MTAIDLISSSLRLVQVLASGEVPTNPEAQDALAILNQLIDQWNAERLTIFTIARLVFVPSVLKQAYTLGPGGDFNIALRPPKIQRCTVISLNNPVQPVELPIDYLTDSQWADIPTKNVPSALPTSVWDDGGFPLRTLSYFPIPNVLVNFGIYAWTQLTQFPDLVTDETFPPGYLKALRYNLALDLAPEYGKSTPPEVAAQAVTSKAIIKSMNVPIIDLKCDRALVNQRAGIYNWLSDQTGIR